MEKLTLKKSEQIKKRIFDVIVAGIGTIILIPVIIIIAVSIKIDSKGKVIYKQTRLGLNGKKFQMLKFRTMKEDAEKDTGPILEKENDERLTKVGKYLRKTKLDEIPQLLNVLIGNMSIVGPRPERPFFAEKIKKDLKEFELRENVKPGISGLACIEGGYYTPPKEKLEYDLIYIRNWSIKEDIVICMKTIKMILKKLLIL